MLNPGTPVGRLGLGPTVKVVFHGRVKGWRGVRVPGERTCATCFMPRRWETRTLAARLGFRYCGVVTTARVVGRAREASAQMAVIPRTERLRLGRAGLKVEARRFLERGLVASAPQREAEEVGALKAVDMIEGILVAVVGTSMEELVLGHFPPKVEPLPPFSTEFERVAMLANLMARQKNWTRQFRRRRPKWKMRGPRWWRRKNGWPVWRNSWIGSRSRLLRTRGMIREGRGGGGRRRRRRGRNRMLKCVGGMARRRIVRVTLGSASRKEKGGRWFGRAVSASASVGDLDVDGACRGAP